MAENNINQNDRSQSGKMNSNQQRDSFKQRSDKMPNQTERKSPAIDTPMQDEDTPRAPQSTRKY
jgi:hypothetical protein